jgi:hypothetical protein
VSRNGLIYIFLEVPVGGREVSGGGGGCEDESGCIEMSLLVLGSWLLVLVDGEVCCIVAIGSKVDRV